LKLLFPTWCVAGDYGTSIVRCKILMIKWKVQSWPFLAGTRTEAAHRCFGETEG
jgi:hypothetical protein